MVVSLLGNQGVFIGCSSWTEIEVGDENQSYKVIDNILYSKDGTSIIRCPTGRRGKYNIEDEVTTLSRYAFENCSNLTEITGGENVSTIGDLSFYSMNALTSMVIKNNVKTIGKYTFQYCSQLYTVMLDSPTVVNNLSSSNAQGYLITNATTIYIKNNISEVPEYITLNYQIQDKSDLDGYIKYIKNSD